MTKSICHIFLGINFVFYFIQSIIKAIQHIFDLISSKIFPFWFLDPIFSNLGEKRPAYQGQGLAAKFHSTPLSAGSGARAGPGSAFRIDHQMY